ncbi:Hypothetical protein OINT_1000002 [Brucella intermedia LMG 3301]|uniref:Uncharacterized protein n=1 Tax=Brucella intermedia LMG 3301 TaxID=641118 RepID=C4WEP6_9HYPH|nr:Hypothetical protein OINT_1000002 [Brucella intermedia LMG 3301]
MKYLFNWRWKERTPVVQKTLKKENPANNEPGFETDP